MEQRDSIYVAEIDGRGIAAINAESTIFAENWFGGPAFHGDLLCLRDERGDVLWDGDAQIHVRPARAPEAEIWQGERAKAALAGEIDQDKAEVLVFLIQVNDDTDDLDD